MTATVEMRNLWGELSPLEFEQSSEPYMVKVPGFGVLIIGQKRSDELIVRLAPQWAALLVQPDSVGGFSEASAKLPRDAKVVDGAVEVELLPNSSDEYRLVVVLHPDPT